MNEWNKHDKLFQGFMLTLTPEEVVKVWNFAPPKLRKDILKSSYMFDFKLYELWAHICEIQNTASFSSVHASRYRGELHRQFTMKANYYDLDLSGAEVYYAGFILGTLKLTKKRSYTIKLHHGYRINSSNGEVYDVDITISLKTPKM